MPELPEVETVRSALAPVVTGQQVMAVYVGRKDLRWPLPEALDKQLLGCRFAAPTRRGKYVLMPNDNGQVLLIHLGMSGSIRIHEAKPELAKHDHMMLTVEADDGGHRYIVLNDPRRFGWVDLFAAEDMATHKLLKDMGPEPLGNAFSATHIQTVFANRKSPVKNALLDQRLIAGIGNIYACEALFKSGISPRRRAGSITAGRADKLAHAIVTVLRAAIAEGGTSLRDHVQPGGEIGYFVQKLSVYGRDGLPCVICETPIRIIVQSGRSSFYCPSCQR
ncbi:bifunctional DNA-formamidopyrimidine glycosylase/DNA-(apurinic or apyrimidinic site) lyase [Candidatus Puniceispirillum marinum]|uniref:Formamidopyrimidine-DNA glycosylase n=1 Tax=Puniceispirillum marinum (strain IMCC1322) TaxID=488538 RepID=D5BU58_PUNMI|nr:bifunctional DNA-formamidopyrimidine glycosylase/DNA-(apurinic or apyrimidinic site) lyase [Candidatus Puniceispirillum marinum]ADE39805.1 formamidopyrimidine-DNA glycosylase [Candidatus Puniceispirillum marinum IMCC1322]